MLGDVRDAAGPRPQAGALVDVVLRDGDPQSVASNYTDCKLIGYKCKAHIDEARGRQQ